MSNIGRVYLPTLVDPDVCYKLPIAVGYTCVAVGKVRLNIMRTNEDDYLGEFTGELARELTRDTRDNQQGK